MSDPPPSTAPPALEPPFLHHPDGRRIGIFVEAGGIHNRPRLIRNLKKHDALICTDPKHAQIILVDPDTYQGREFIREWGKDENKVVLSHTWLSKSIGAGKALLAEDNWGGTRTRDDGLPIERPTADGDDAGPAPKSPLPTPRETPMEANKAPAKRRKSSDARPKGHSSLPRLSTTPGSVESGTFSPSSSHPPLTQPPQPHSQSAPVRSPTLSDAMSVYSQQQQQAQQHQATQGMPFGMSNMMMPNFSMPVNMMPFGPQMLAMMAQQQQANPSIGTQPPPMMPQMQENFATALLDVMKMYPGMPGMGQWPAFPNMTSAMQQQQTGQPAEGSATATANGSGMREGSAASMSRMATDSPTLSTFVGPASPSSVLQSSIQRKRKSDAMEHDSADDLPGTGLDSDSFDDDGDEPPLAVLYRKKKKAEERESEAKKKRKEEKDERKGRRSNGTQYAVIPPRNPHDAQSTKPMSTGDISGKLFAHPGGKPMQFFVQVDMNNRQEVARAVKKNGGIIKSMIPGADYAVLSSLSSTFKNLLDDAVVSQIPAVTHHFVIDSVKQGSIPDDLSIYLFDAKQKSVRRRKFANATEAENKRIARNARQTEYHSERLERKYNYVARPGTPDSQSSSAQASTSTSSASTIQRPPTLLKKSGGTQMAIRSGVPKGKQKADPPVKKITTPAKPTPSTSPQKIKRPGYYPRDVTPPPPNNPEKMARGYLYTPEEKEWAEKYIYILFKRDPDMSPSKVSRLLHKKLQHHSVGSWGTFLSLSFKTQFDDARKKGGIAHRKEKSLWESEQEKQRLEREDLGRAQAAEKSSKEKEDERKKQQEEREEEREIEDHVMGDVSAETVANNPVSPMQVDGSGRAMESIAPRKNDPEEASDSQKLTKQEEADIQTVVQFFLDGGDQGEDEELVWAKLAQRAPRKSKQGWIDFFTRYDKIIVDEYKNKC